MGPKTRRISRTARLLHPVSLAVFFTAVFAARPARAALPASGTITPSGGPITWIGTATGGASESETTCVDGINCDSFTLTVSGAPADWAGLVIPVQINWNLMSNDYDLYVHKGPNSGPVVGRSAGGPPEVMEATQIDPAATGTGIYTVHVVYFLVSPLPPDQYRGTISVAPKPASRLANYISGGITFSPNVTVRAPVAPADGEPSSRTDFMGNHYVVGIRGVPAGVDLWYFDLQPGSPTYDPFMRTPQYRGQPDTFTPGQANSVGADGGGDVDIAVGFGAPTGSLAGPFPILASSSLVASNVSTQRSRDRGISFDRNPAGSAPGIPIDDRQWLEFFGTNSVYLFYRTLAPALSQIQRSNDGGFTYGPAATAGFIGQAGGVSVDQNDGTVYVAGSSGNVCTGIPPMAGLAPVTYTCHQAASDPNGVAHLFFLVKAARDGTVYVAYSNDSHIFLANSVDKGAHWSLPVQVDNGVSTLTNVLPAMATGPLPGSVGLAWYGTTDPINENNADWQVYYAQTFDATDMTPTFLQALVSDHVIHASNISEGGTLGNANRNLLDYFQISFDPTGAAVIDYTDDHNDFTGHTYVTRQTSGPGIGGMPVPNPGSPPPPVPPPPDGAQVVDFPHDVADALLIVIDQNDPLDILSIRYSCETASDGGPVLVATMKVSDLSTIPAAANWRMNFTANAPNSVLSPVGDYSFGVSDRGDQFFVRASTDPTIGQFTFGTVVRNSDGSLSSTIRGAADSGMFNTANNTITVKVAASKLNPFVRTGNPPVAVGSVLAGLRGSTFTSQVNAKRDIARGGTQFTVANCSGGGGGGGGPDGGTGGGPDGGTGGNGPVIKVTGGGSIDDKVRSFGFNADRSLSGHLNYQDKQENFHLVSTAITNFSQTGPTEVTFGGTGTIDRDAANFQVTVRDMGTGHGRDDFFGISITGARNSTHSGNLSTGNIEFHR